MQPEWQGGVRGLLRCICIAILVIAIVECFFFNFRCLQTCVGDHTPAKLSSITAVDADAYEQDGRFVVEAQAGKPSLLLHFDQPSTIDSLTLDIASPASSSMNIWTEMGFDAEVAIKVNIYAGSVSSEELSKASSEERPDYYKDLLARLRSGNLSTMAQQDLPRPIGSQTIVANIPSTETMVIVPSVKNCENLTVSLTGLAKGTTLYIDKITTNAAVPYNFSLFRLLLEILIAAFVIAVRPKSSLRKLSFKRPKAVGILTIALFIVLSVAATAFVCASTNMEDHVVSNETEITDTKQYQHLADSLLQGKPYLDIEAPEWMAELDNPYDLGSRQRMILETGEKTLFDYAYHDGRYYSYFGVLPAALMFAPYKAVTGLDLPTGSATLVLSIIACLVLWLFTWAILRRYGQEASVIDYVLYGSMMFLSSGVVYLAYYPSFYHIAILSGLIVAVLGITLWLVAEKNGRVRRVPLILGCISVALTLLARPTFFLSILLIFPIFWKNITGIHGYVKEFFALNKRSIINTLCVVLTFAVIGGVAMYWNYVRFGSPLDFGANYNLTGFDMTTKQNSLFATIYSYLLFLFAPPLTMLSDFPFILHSPAIGDAIVEPYYFGAFFAMPAFWALFAVFRKRWRSALKEHGAFGIVVIGSICALLIVSIDATVAVTQRYQSDFQWILAMATIAMFCTFDRTYKMESRSQSIKVMNIALVACILVALFLMTLNLFDFDRYMPLEVSNPQIFFTVASWFAA